MSIPGFTADVVFELPVHSRLQRSSGGGQGRSCITPALHTEEWYRCYSRQDGTVGWCGTICEDDVCHYVHD
jgi:hypothetical protein